MPRETTSLSLDELDLRHVAKILNRVYPHFSLCDCARMAASFAPAQDCVCTICEPGTYPACIMKARTLRPQAA